MGKKDPNNQIEQWRKKEKQKEKKKLAQGRKDQFEEELKASTFTDAAHDIQDQQRLRDAGLLSHKGQHALQRKEKYMAVYAPELKKREHETKEKSATDALETALDKQKRVARFSVWYDAVENPFGIPPPGEKPQYRHPDGSVREEPPFEDEDQDTKKRKLEAKMALVPGFSRAMLEKLSADAAEKEGGGEKESAVGARESGAGAGRAGGESSIMYIPQLPTEPYPFYEPAVRIFLDDRWRFYSCLY